MCSFGCASTAARHFSWTTTLPKKTWSVDLLVLVGPPPQFYGPRTLSAGGLDAGAGVQHPGAVCRRFCTNRNAINSFGRVWFWTCAYLLSLVPCLCCLWSVATLPCSRPHCPCCLKSFRRRPCALLRVDSLPQVFWFGRRGADWDCAVLDPAALSHGPQGLPTPGPDRFNATTARDSHI